MTLFHFTGMLLVNPLVAYLDGIEGHTWRDTIRIFSLVVFITGFVCALPMTRRGMTVFGTTVHTKEGYEDLDKQCSDVKGEGQSDIHEEEKHQVMKKDPPARQNSLILLFDNQTPGILLGWTSGMLLLAVAIFIPKVHFVSETGLCITIVNNNGHYRTIIRPFNTAPPSKKNLKSILSILYRGLHATAAQQCDQPG